MRRLKDWRQRVSEHLRAAQGWLSKAEQSFEEKKTIRGELNLMLAEAELRRAQERKQAGKNRIRYALYRHGGAFLCAVFFIGIGTLCWQAMTPEEVPVTTSPTQVMTVVQETEETIDKNIVTKSSIIEVETPSMSNVNKMEEKMATPIVQTHSITHDNTQSASRVSISEEEMAGIMQAAGRSLRGQ